MPAMPMPLSSNIVSLRRWRMAGAHLAISFLVAALAAGVIFLLWFPAPYSDLAGGTDLFILLMTVDVVAGPALTFVAASPVKPRSELRRDLAVIALLQLGALGYGMYVVSQARPVLVSFEVDRFRLVSAAEIDAASLEEAPAGMRTLSWSGPRLIAAVKPTDSDQAFRSLQLGMAGIDLSMDPRNWRPYQAQAEVAWRAAVPLQRVLDRYPTANREADRISRSAALPISALRCLPLQARQTIWVAVLAEPGARIVGYLPVDGFL